MDRWFIGFQKVRNDRGKVAHLMFPGFVVSEKGLSTWDDAKIFEHLLFPLREAEDVVRDLRDGKLKR